jgi:hypothetical protein
MTGIEKKLNAEGGKVEESGGNIRGEKKERNMEESKE